ncbi:unannotated protein [freshwater metagenome]|uniref:Unannotated protein n=1 Tax=freshwater metagenome TaxID=449393 RepID=A0A6J6JZX7_9ZZZZ
MVSPTTSPLEFFTCMWLRGIPRPVASNPQATRFAPAAFSAASESLPEKFGLFQPTAQPVRA